MTYTKKLIFNSTLLSPNFKYSTIHTIRVCTIELVKNVIETMSPISFLYFYIHKLKVEFLELPIPT